MRWLIVVVLVLTALSIRIPIVPNQKRCMVAFVYGNGETVKLHMKFPKSRNTQYEENWHIAITDTETKVTQDFEVSHGHFRQELETEQSVLYEICFWINGRQTGVYFLSYEANVNFHVKASEIKLPDNLPKNKDVRNTYKTAERLVHLGKLFREFQDKRNIVQDDKFSRTAEIGFQLLTVLRIELLALSGLALLQIFALRNWFKKQYLL